MAIGLAAALAHLGVTYAHRDDAAGSVATPAAAAESDQVSAARALAERQRKKSQQEDELRRRQLAERLAAEEAVAARAAALAEQKEDAWERFYQKPPECISRYGSVDETKCANDLVRAKRDFEARFARGDLR